MGLFCLFNRVLTEALLNPNRNLFQTFENSLNTPSLPPMTPRPNLPGLSPISTAPPDPDSPGSVADRHGATSASEPSSPIEPSRGRLRQRHKTRSTASLVDYTEHATPYWVPAGSIPIPGPPLPPRYTSQSEGEDSEVEMERRSAWPWNNHRPLRPPRAIQTGAGTETEDAYDTSASRSLPNTRVTPSNANSSNPFNPVIFQLLRLLSIVPAFLGSCYHLYSLIFASTPRIPDRIDSFIALVFAIVTLNAHLGLTTGLLLRWRTFYAPMAVLVRLLALQSICWPATHLTLLVLSHSKRPTVCWAVIASTTCISRSIQMWVCSNLAVIRSPEHTPHGKRPSRLQRVLMPPAPLPLRSRPRKWDWNRVLLRCGLPLGVCYFIMAWGEILKRELSLGS